MVWPHTLVIYLKIKISNMDVLSNVDNGKYDNLLPDTLGWAVRDEVLAPLKDFIGTKKELRQKTKELEDIYTELCRPIREKYVAEHARLEKLFKDDLAKECGIFGNPKSDIIYEITNGEYSYEEIVGEYKELVKLIPKRASLINYTPIPKDESMSVLDNVSAGKYENNLPTPNHDSNDDWIEEQMSTFVGTPDEIKEKEEALRDIDSDKYYTARDNYMSEWYRLENSFKNDIEAEFGLLGHPSAKLLFQRCFEHDGFNEYFYNNYQNLSRILIN
jgi:hypothetical protein